MKKARCNKCNTIAKKEMNKRLKKEYPFYCPCCGENLYRFETHKDVCNTKNIELRKR